jgi:soluble lytic murein transglycosylase-like protein
MPVYRICFRPVGLWLSLALLILLFPPASAEVKVYVDAQGTIQIRSEQEIRVTPPSRSRLERRREAMTATIEEVADRYKVDPSLVMAVIEVESAFNAKAVSSAGAIGLMQLMPMTAKRFGVKDPYDPIQNLHGGVQYLRFLLSEFKHDLRLAVAAYNAGETAVSRYGDVPPYKQTQNFVKKVLTAYVSYRETARTAQKVYQFVNDSGTLVLSNDPSKRSGG